MAANGSEHAAAAAAGREPRTIIPATAATATQLDPRLFMAARRGDSKQLKDLLQLEEDGEDIRVDVDIRVPDAAAGQQQLQPAAAPLPIHGDGGGVTMEGDSLLHVVAACGDGDEFIECAKMIVRDKERKGGVGAKRQVLQARNSNGDTPLHCAAGAGNANMISCLVALAADDMEAALVRMQNQCGETALHQAIRAANNKQACIDRLMSVDSGLACIPRDDDDAEEDGASSSPLYLAISLGELEVAGHLFRRTGGNLSYSGPHGRNVLHAAVSRGPALPMVLNWLKGLRTVGMQVDRRHADLLLQQLTSQRDKQADGSSPLHLAATLYGWPSGGFLAKWFPQVWSWSAPTVSLLLDANESTAYQPDSKGSYPIHVAAWSGSLFAVKRLLQQCPDCATLRDGQGRTFLHVAAETEEYAVDRVVEYACRMAELSSILNARDKNGDTALHKAVRAGNLAAFNCLFQNRQVRLDVQNNEALTPLDLSWSMLPAGPETLFYYRLNPASIMQVSLENAGAPHGGSRSDIFKAKHFTRVDEGRTSETYNYSSQAMGIVSVLIATVTFASAFTLPGGYQSAGDSSTAVGTPVLAGAYAFDAFVVADTLAFLCSSLATFCIVYTGIPALHQSIREKYIVFAIAFLHGAGRSFVAAFGLGLYLVLAPVDQAAAATVCVITFASLLYGNIELWQYLGVLNTVRLRLGTIRIPPARVHIREFILWVLGCYWSLIIIFGLPAIFKWARKQ